MSKRTTEARDEPTPSFDVTLEHMNALQKRGEYSSLPEIVKIGILNRSGIDIVPPNPTREAIRVMEKFKREGIDNMLLCFTPAIDIRRIRHTGYKKPDFGFLTYGPNRGYFTDPSIKTDLLSTQAGWKIIDTRNISINNYEYLDDSRYLGGILSNLRSQGKLEGPTPSRNQGSRKGITQLDIETIVAPEVARRFGVSPARVSLPTLAEANFIGNTYFPVDWNFTIIGEWFANRLGRDYNQALYGRYKREIRQAIHPLSVVAVGSATSSMLDTGFRLQFNF